MENSIPYKLLPPGNPANAYRCWFNDPDPADGTFIGYLDGETGITGLDSPDVRENAEDLASRDGGYHGNFFYGRRPVVMEGIFNPHATPAEVVGLAEKLGFAVNALRGDCVLQWTNSDSKASPYTAEVLTKRLYLRRNGRYQGATGRRPKRFQLPLVCATPIIESTIEEVRDPGGLAVTYRNVGNGWAYPVIELHNTTGGTTVGDIDITNSWNADDLIRMSNGYGLPTGQKLVFDTYYRTVFQRATGASSGGTNVRRYLARAVTTWTVLGPWLGGADWTITANRGSKVVLTYRHSWISS